MEGQEHKTTGVLMVGSQLSKNKNKGAVSWEPDPKFSFSTSECGNDVFRNSAKQVREVSEALNMTW